MSFLDNMPSRNADNFSLLLSGEAVRRQEQKPVEYVALNDTQPPEGQVIGMCQGHSVLGLGWQQPLPPADKRGLKRSLPPSSTSHAHRWSPPGAPPPPQPSAGDSRGHSGRAHGSSTSASTAPAPPPPTGARDILDWNGTAGGGGQGWTHRAETPEASVSPGSTNAFRQPWAGLGSSSSADTVAAGIERRRDGSGVGGGSRGGGGGGCSWLEGDGEGAVVATRARPGRAKARRTYGR